MPRQCFNICDWLTLTSNAVALSLSSFSAAVRDGFLSLFHRVDPIAMPFPRQSAFHISDYGTMILKPEPVESECNVDMGVCTIIRLQFPLNAS